jgi:signal transduction histidine kinase
MTTSPSIDASLNVDSRPPIGRRQSLERYFDGWLVTLDPDLRLALVDPKSWWVIAAFVALMLAAIRLHPSAAAFFVLDPWLAGLCFLPTLLLGLFVGSLQKHGKLTLRGFGALCILGSTFFQWSTWTFVALSSLPGAAAMAATPILLAAYHGHAFRSTARYPFIAAGTVAAMAAAWPLAVTSSHAGIFIIGSLIAVASSITLGENASHRGRALSEREALREAVHAQLLSDRANHADQLTRLLLSLRTNNHDASNALSGALMNMELLLRKLEQQQLANDEAAEVVTLTSDVVSSLRNLAGLIEEARNSGKKGASASQRVVAGDVLARVVREVNARFPDLDIHLAPVPSDCELALVGGSQVLERIARNLLVNAAEGDGASRPRRVDVQGDWDGRNLVLSVLDDGPGFRADHLVQSSGRFATTKAWGSGLGLYTVNKLASAQGGTTTIGNREPHGASVRVVLPSADEIQS